MGREIRRVPPNWEHPKRKKFDCLKGIEVESYQPLYDQAFSPSMREWYAEWDKWERGERPEGSENTANYWDWNCGPPDPEYYRPDWPEQSATWFQVYETVSEGTPVTPPFATEDEIINYLADNGDFWDQARVKEGRREGPAAWGRDAAERFVRSRWAPSLMIMGGQVIEPSDGGLPVSEDAGT